MTLTRGKHKFYNKILPACTYSQHFFIILVRRQVGSPTRLHNYLLLNIFINFSILWITCISFLSFNDSNLNNLDGAKFNYRTFFTTNVCVNVNQMLKKSLNGYLKYKHVFRFPFSILSFPFDSFSYTFISFNDSP